MRSSGSKRSRFVAAALGGVVLAAVSTGATLAVAGVVAPLAYRDPVMPRYAKLLDSAVQWPGRLEGEGTQLISDVCFDADEPSPTADSDVGSDRFGPNVAANQDPVQSSNYADSQPRGSYGEDEGSQPAEQSDMRTDSAEPTADARSENVPNKEDVAQDEGSAASSGDEATPEQSDMRTDSAEPIAAARNEDVPNKEDVAQDDGSAASSGEEATPEQSDMRTDSAEPIAAARNEDVPNKEDVAQDEESAASSDEETTPERPDVAEQAADSMVPSYEPNGAYGDDEDDEPAEKSGESSPAMTSDNQSSDAPSKQPAMTDGAEDRAGAEPSPAVTSGEEDKDAQPQGERSAAAKDPDVSSNYPAILSVVGELLVRTGARLAETLLTAVR